MGSSEICWQDNPFKWCANFTADKYALMVPGARPRTKWHHITNSRHVSEERGQGKDVHEAASKQEKALRPEPYFSHVDFEIEEFMRAAK